MSSIRNRDLVPECIFQTSRSQGAGGQHVNKTETKVTLWFPVQQSEQLSNSEKARIIDRLHARINQEGYLQIVVQETRSQWQNKAISIERLYNWLEAALKPRKRRKPTRPGKAAKQRRLDAKKKQAEKKQRRNKGNWF